jgi:hypothetical protein
MTEIQSNDEIIDRLWKIILDMDSMHVLELIRDNCRWSENAGRIRWKDR